MSQKQIYIIIISIITVGVIAVIFVLTLNNIFSPDIPDVVQTPKTVKITKTPGTVEIPEAAELSTKPLPELTAEIWEKIEDKQNSKSRMPPFPVFNVEGEILELRENGFRIKTMYGRFNVVFVENTSVFESQVDANPIKGKMGLYLLSKDDTVIIFTFNSLNENKTVTAKTVTIVKQLR